MNIINNATELENILMITNSCINSSERNDEKPIEDFKNNKTMYLNFDNDNLIGYVRFFKVDEKAVLDYIRIHDKTDNNKKVYNSEILKKISLEAITQIKNEFKSIYLDQYNFDVIFPNMKENKKEFYELLNFKKDQLISTRGAIVSNFNTYSLYNITKLI